MTTSDFDELTRFFLLFCVNWTADDRLATHSGAITEVKKVCYQDEFGYERCEENWKVVNSWGGHFQGWLKARALARTFTPGNKVSTIRPCSNDPSPLQTCVPNPLNENR
jgi:hypothetical protein